MIKKINIDELRVGMYISGLEKDEPGKVLSFMNSILMKDEKEIDRLKNSGYMFIHVVEDDVPYGAFNAPVKEPSDEQPPDEIKEEIAAIEAVAVQTPITEVKEEEPRPIIAPEPPLKKASSVTADSVDFYEELQEAKRIRNDAEDLVRGFMQSVVTGTDIKSQQVHETVGEMVDSIFRNQNALTSLARLKSFDDYTFAHSVNVCILSLTMGRQIGLGESELHDLGVGAILHDIGKMLVPESILKKPGALSEAEFGVMRKHTSLGGDLLYKTRDISDESRYISLHHHEKFDGSGYQDSLKGGEIHIFARIACVADVYDAMTSNRVYQKGMLPEVALKKMYALRGNHFDPELVDRLVKCLGIYPIGSLVELNTGETAIVRVPNNSHPLQPRVLMFSDRNKKTCEKPFEVDLKDQIGKWIVSSKDPGPLKPVIDDLINQTEIKALLN
ncbi:MAG: HD-GYP domain-containing protein [Deltaproteobacteria bacterium]|nr:HD-GYP domain-containing protein [Deltaproteobacteria bacterium]